MSCYEWVADVVTGAHLRSVAKRFGLLEYKKMIITMNVLCVEQDIKGVN